MEASPQALLELLELQKMDSALDRLSVRLRSLPEQAELDALEERYRAQEKVAGERQAALQDVSSRQRRLESDIDTIVRKIQLEEARLNAGDVGSPRELASIGAEIESLKRRRLRFEDDDLEIMQERENLEKELNELTAELKGLRSDIEAAIERRDAASAHITSDLQSYRTRRDAWIPRIPSELLAYYNDLRRSKGGVGAAALSGSTCLGCHMQLPAQEIERIHRTPGLVRCEECGRILIITGTH